MWIDTYIIDVAFLSGQMNFYTNKTKYFRLRLTDEVSSEGPKKGLRLT